jgi:hypothetical protein
MIYTLDHSDPTIYREVNLLKSKLLEAKFHFAQVQYSIAEVISLEQFKSNSSFAEIVHFKEHAFETNDLDQHSVAFFLHYGGMAKSISDSIEYFRFEYRLLENVEFEESYVVVCQFLDLMFEIYEKIQAIRHTYFEDLSFLNN